MSNGNGAPDDNGLRNETGALIGGLHVEDYVAGIRDFSTGSAPPAFTSPSYDLGRQKAARDKAAKDQFEAWMKAQEDRADKTMREILPPALYGEYRAKIDAIRRGDRVVGETTLEGKR